jgi:isopenicillin N synthase-like dioxygenase
LTGARRIAYGEIMLPVAKKVPLTHVPIVDLTAMRSGDPAARRALADEIAQACVDLGFFYIVNHGIPQTSVDAMFAAAKRFFALPEAERMALEISKATHYRGYIPLKLMAQAPTFAASSAELKGNLYDAFQIHAELPPDDPDVLAKKPLHAANPWPAAMPELRALWLAYYAQLGGFAAEMLRLFALGLDLPETALDRFFRKPMMQLRMLHYPPQDPGDPGENMGLRPHTDSGAFTILAQDRVGGLEVQTRSNEWIEVPPLAGSFVINLGEMMKVWSDQTLLATPHRVVNKYGHERYSIPFFMTPDFDAPIEPLVHNPAKSAAPSFATSVSAGRTCGEVLVPLYDRIWPAPAGAR